MATIEQLLSGLSVDLVTLSEYSGGRYAVIQRDPQPNEADIAQGTHIGMMIIDLDYELQVVSGGFGHAPFAHFPFGHISSLAGGAFDFDVYVDGSMILSWDSGTTTATWYLGYTGTVTPSLVSSPFSSYVVDAIPPAVFSSEQVVEVRVIVTPTSPALDTTYQFTIEDLTPPNILSAEAFDQFNIRVTFDDNMSVEGVGSALNVASYSIDRLNVDPVPAVNLEIVSISPVTGTGNVQFDLTVDWEQTPGSLYRVNVSQLVTDSSGNQMVPDAYAEFSGFSPEQPMGRFFDHWRMMIPLKNRLEDETRDAERLSGCVQEVLNLILYTIDHFIDQYDPDTCTDDEIDLMLVDMGNPFDWADLELTPNQRRKLLRFLVDIYLSKGTAIGIEQTTLFLLGEVVDVVEYLTGGWILGESALGEGNIAQLPILAVGPYDFTAVSQPWTMAFAIDEGAAQVVTFSPSDFLNPATATVEEVRAVIDATLVGAGTYTVEDGEPAILFNSNLGPFTIVPGTDITITGPLVTSTPATYTFGATDFVNMSIVTADDLVALLIQKFPEITFEVNSSKGIIIRTLEMGTTSEVTISGTSLVAIGFTPSTSTGKDGKRFYVYSDTSGIDASIECTTADTGIADEIFKIWMNPTEATGSTILAPDDSYTKYSFDIETSTVVDSYTELLIRRIAEYMKPAHTHLINIRTALPLPWPEDWEIGVGQLDDSTSLAP